MKIEKCRECIFWRDANTDCTGESPQCFVDPEPHYRSGDCPICLLMEDVQSDDGIEVTLPDGTWCRGPQV
jgi:hypothetical protein